MARLEQMRLAAQILTCTFISACAAPEKDMSLVASANGNTDTTATGESTATSAMSSTSASQGASTSRQPTPPEAQSAQEARPPMRAGSAVGDPLPADAAMPMSTSGAPAAPASRSTRDGADTATMDERFADCVESMMATDSGGQTPYPGGHWSVSEPSYGTLIERDIAREMSDGAVLVGDVSYPADLKTGARAAGKFPVILTLNPYGAGAFGPEYGEIFVTHGYIFVSFDVRGTSRSNGGPQDLFSPRDADDGAELVAWAAQLDGADGTIGLQGCSQLGINQLETATRLGPNSPVKAMIPACPSGDFYRDTAFDNGIPSITAAALVPDADTGADTAYYREFWQTRDRVARAPKIAQADIPALLWSGWHEPGAMGSMELYVVLQNVAAGRPAWAPIAAGQAVSGKYQVIIGDWGHGGGLDLGIELQWYDTWLKGIDTGMPTDTRTPLHIAELGGTNRWFNARCYPLVERYTPLFLSTDNRLSSSAVSDESQDELQWVQQDRTSDSLEYASEPFADGALLAGPIAAQLQVSSSNTNLQLYTEVLDKAPNGTLSQISFGSIMGTLRKTNPEKSWSDPAGLPTRPYLALDEDQPMTPDEKTQLVVPLGTKVWSIEPGHSVVVRIAAHPPNDSCIGVIVPPVGCYPTQPMLETLRDGQYKIHLGGELGSLVSLPLLKRGAFPTARTAVSPTNNNSTPLPVRW